MPVTSVNPRCNLSGAFKGIAASSQEAGSGADWSAYKKMGQAAKRKQLRAAAPQSTADATLALAQRARRAAEAGDVATALTLYVQAVQGGTTSADVFNDFGVVLARDGRLASAVVQFELALVYSPGHHDARENLKKALETIGLTAFQQGKWIDAGAAYGRLTVLDPDCAIHYNNAGAALREMKYPDQALVYLRRSESLDPNNPSVHYNLGSALFDMGSREAEVELRRAIDLDPTYVDAMVNLALVQDRLGKLAESAALLNQALRLSPTHGEAHGNLASVLRDQGDISGSMEHFRRALELRPESSTIFSSFLLARQGDPEADPLTVLAEHRAWASRFAAHLDPGPAGGFGTRDREPLRRLRVGYVSADFRSHSVASFIEPLIAAHDRTQIEVVCYSDAVPDAVTQRIRDGARPDGWCESRLMSDAALAEKIVADEIDVLVDLAGHTAGNRLLCFARRPAPVQVTSCGYPGTTGLAAMGWRLTDAITDPETESDGHWTERLWRAPNGFLCFQPDPSVASSGQLPAETRGFVTFGSFNNLAKVGDAVLTAWADVLKRTPGSRILLKARALSDEQTGRRLRQEFAARGIEADRVEIAPYAASPREHLALYGRVDIALDTFPYNGTTTTCEALWMGVPVVTVLGRAHAGRVGASLLHRIGCDDLTARSASEYVRIAAGLATDRERLADLRATLRSRMEGSPLTNATVIARDVEAAYREMWRLWCAREPGNWVRGT